MHQSSPPRRPIIPVSNQNKQAPAPAGLRKHALITASAESTATPSVSDNSHRQSFRETLASRMHRLREPSPSKGSSQGTGPIDPQRSSGRAELDPGQQVHANSDMQDDARQNTGRPLSALPASRQRSLLGFSIVQNPVASMDNNVIRPVQQQRSLPRQLPSGYIAAVADDTSPRRQPFSPQRRVGSPMTSSPKAGLNPAQEALPTSAPASPNSPRHGGLTGIRKQKSGIPAEQAMSNTRATPKSSRTSPVHLGTDGSNSNAAPAVGIEIMGLDGPSVFGLASEAMLLVGAAATHPASGRVLATGQG